LLTPKARPVRRSKVRDYLHFEIKIHPLEVYSQEIFRIDINPSVPGLSEISNIQKFEFLMEANSIELRNAVNNAIEKLRANYPDYTFKGKFRGGK
jgi:hypothetical protein